MDKKIEAKAFDKIERLCRNFVETLRDAGFEREEVSPVLESAINSLCYVVYSGD